jgi:hypothetical protein
MDRIPVLLVGSHARNMKPKLASPNTPACDGRLSQAVWRSTRAKLTCKPDLYNPEGCLTHRYLTDAGG